MGLKCNRCGTVTCPPKMTCQECAGTDLEITELSGRGTITTFTTTYVAPWKGRSKRLTPLSWSSLTKAPGSRAT
ncbi:zinc ribbon domain-containing protein [Desulfonema ishimotonii]